MDPAVRTIDVSPEVDFGAAPGDVAAVMFAPLSESEWMVTGAADQNRLTSDWQLMSSAIELARELTWLNR